MLSNFTAFQKQAFELGQQLLADGGNDDDSDLDGLDTAGFGVALAAHASDTVRKLAPTQDKPDVASSSNTSKHQDGADSQHALETPPKQAELPVNTAEPSEPEAQATNVQADGYQFQGAADGWGSGVDDWEGSWSHSKTPSPVEAVADQPPALQTPPEPSSVGDPIDAKPPRQDAAGTSAANQSEDIRNTDIATDHSTKACGSIVQQQADGVLDAAEPVGRPDGETGESTVSTASKLEADREAGASEAATVQVAEAEGQEPCSEATDAGVSSGPVEHSEQQNETITAQNDVRAGAAEPVCSNAQGASHDPAAEHPAAGSHQPATSSAVECEEDVSTNNNTDSGAEAVAAKDPVDSLSEGIQPHETTHRENDDGKKDQPSSVGASRSPMHDDSATETQEAPVHSAAQEDKSEDLTEQLVTPKAVKAGVAEYVALGADSAGMESIGDSNDGSSSEGLGGMKDMLAIGDSVSQLQGWLWGKSSESEERKESSLGEGGDSADKKAPKLEAAGSPLSTSKLSPTVQLVKNTFSPLQTSAESTGTPNKDSSKLTADNQISKGEADSVGNSSAPNVDVSKLQETLAARESQLEAQANQIGDLNETLAALQKKNQELVLKGAKVSEEDMAELQEEFETRLGRAERRVFALTKERDAAKRQLASAITPSTLQARDAKISQLENEKAEVERRAVNLSHKIEDQARKLTAKETELTTLRNEKETNANRAAQAEKAAATALADAESARAAARQASDTGKTQAASAQKRAHAEAADKVRKAEERARIAEEEGGAKVRAQRDQLADSVQQLQEQLAAAEQAYAAEEERLQERITAEACAKAEAEVRYERAEAAVAEATQPLLRRVEALTQELVACQGLLRSAAAGEKRAESACAAAATETSAAAAQATKAEKAMHQALFERDSAQTKAAAAAEALASVEQSLAEEQRQTATLRTEASSIAAKLEHTQLELQETKHLLVTAKRSIQSIAGGAAVPASDGTPPITSNHLQRTISAVSKPDADNPTNASPAEAAVQSGFHAGGESIPAAPEHARDLNRTASTSSVMDGVVWVPDKGLSVSVSHDGAAADAETYRERWEQSEAARRTLEDTMYTLAREAAGAKAERDAVRAEMESLRGAHERHNAAIELLGEREERIAELEADMKDMKLLYREQIDFMATQLEVGQGSG